MRMGPIARVLNRANGLRCLQCEATEEDRQVTEQGLFVRSQQLVAPGDGISERALTGREIAGTVGQK